MHNAAPRHPAKIDWRWRVIAMSVAFMAGLLGVLLMDRMGPLSQLETASLDWRFRLRGPRPAPREVGLLVIDEATLDALGGWPLSRQALAETIERLRAVGARVAALDMVLAEAHRLPDGTLAAEDAALADTIREAKGVVFPVAFGFQPEILGDRTTPEELRSHAYRVVLRGENSPDPPLASQVLLPARAFLAAMPTLGHVSLELAGDGVLRYDLPAIQYEDEIYPSFGVAALGAFLGIAPEDIVLDLNRGVMVGSRLVPFDRDYRHYLNFYGPEGTIRRHSLIDLLEARTPRELFSGRLVVIGVDALGMGDRFPTPFVASLSGAEYLATSIANMIDGTSLHRGPRQTGLDVMVIALLAALTATVMARGRPVISIAWVVALIVFVAAWCQAWFVLADWWVSFAFPALAIVIAATITQLTHAVIGLRQTRLLEHDRATLARHFAPQVVDELLRRDYRVQLDRSQNAAVVFFDLVGFTTLCEQMRPGEAIALVRGFHRLVEAAVFRHGGMIANFAGDGVMCCFGIPEAREDAALDAILAARDLVSSLEDWRAQPAYRRHGAIGVGVGVHSGNVLIGNVGGEQQLQYSAIGDTVNTASRLESLTRELGTPILISARAMAEAQACRPKCDLNESFVCLGPIILRGRDEPITVWGLASTLTSTAAETAPSMPGPIATN